ncbi:hypothetical protein Ngar_c08560 [Candidatus Nitrososphaera gargensis Ga9.2]|uniref:Uncharacterized protein n=1 Tax=Nitrososphaera gargensis (strain Ga9.2) TaxID=1237085 RepID=K0IG58_NITGG|nr:hypothetical protein Ngar_c08560 [Candidatus Nitrososphaera gargensis Ga9.2]
MIKAEILRFADLKAGQTTPVGLGIAKSLRLGQHLHMVLVVTRPNNFSKMAFPTDELLAYDVEITDDVGKTMTLKDLGLIGGKNSIVYQRETLPTFFLRGKDAPLNFLHGSCRKLHGKGEDCLAAADDLIESSFADLKRRPNVLFLTGDQIYADDVAGPLSHYLTQLGIRLLGWEEKINGVGKKLTEIRIGERQSLVKKYAGFTSPNAGNHLLSFGEFAAMYLLAWNAENWPAKFPDISTVSKEHQNKYREQIRQLEHTRKDLPAVRRVLANIPTYMIFDDHEITDDWNITREWQENVKGSKCGKQVVANGLAAYWAFQGWGNDPALYSSDFIGKIVEFLGKNGEPTEAERDAFEDLLWNFDNWTFRAPITPLTVVMDCRTQRQYDSHDGPPQLLSSKGFHSILQAAKEANYQKGDPIIIVLPTPVFGFLLLEALQKAAAKITGVYKLDLETWFANESGLVNFLSFLMHSLGPRHCIFLSGDVHYGFTISAAFALLQNGHEYLHMSITQLNSSALKTTSLVKIAFISEIMGRIRQLFPWRQVVRIGWVNGGLSNNRFSSKSLRIKGKPTRHLYVRPRKSPELSKQRSPDWIEARTIVKASGSIIPPLLISDNNIGLVSIEDSKVIQRFLVRKEITKDTRIHQTVVEMNQGRNELDELISAKMREFATEHSTVSSHESAN